jgi:serine/threonine protein phosphatase PrpC
VGRLPFQTRLTHFRFPKLACDLPFVVGGVTQHHEDSATESRNSQDAFTVIIEPTVMVGVVADGCSGTHAALEASCHSSNEVGAKLTTYLVSRSALAFATANPGTLHGERFARHVAATTRRGLSTVLRACAGQETTAREMFTLDFLMATILGFVATREWFAIFHSGDGVIGLNGKLTTLESESGRYLGNELVRSGARLPKPSIKIFASGSSENLQNILLATDGLSALVGDHHDQLVEFMNGPVPPSQSRNGFDFLLQEFRQKIAWNQDIALRIYDDATFVLLRRIGGDNLQP